MRTVMQGDKILFCGADVARALGYSNARDALTKHCKNSTLIKCVANRDTLCEGGNQTMLYIPEGDGYRLIVSSKLPSAQKFENWVFDEVLPNIRKHGVYAVEERKENRLAIYVFSGKTFAELL